MTPLLRGLALHYKKWREMYLADNREEGEVRDPDWAYKAAGVQAKWGEPLEHVKAYIQKGKSPGCACFSCTTYLFFNWADDPVDWTPQSDGTDEGRNNAQFVSALTMNGGFRWLETIKGTGKHPWSPTWLTRCQETATAARQQEYKLHLYDDLFGDHVIQAFAGMRMPPDKYEREKVKDLLESQDIHNIFMNFYQHSGGGSVEITNFLFRDLFHGVEEYAEYARPEWAYEDAQEQAEKSANNTAIEVKSKGTTSMKKTDIEGAIKNDSNEVFKNPIVVREGEKIILPKGMSCAQGIEALKRQKEEDERVVAIDITINAFLYEGLFALQNAMKEKFGWVDLVPTPSFFGPKPPRFITIDIGVGKKAQVVWGRIEIPGIDGHVDTAWKMQDGKPCLRLAGNVKQRFRRDVEELAQLAENFVKSNSIYRGNAVKVKFPTDEEIATGSFNIDDCPKFIDTSKTDESQLIFSDDLYQAVETAIFIPIENTDMCRKHGISLKRGTLLAGQYGVGKSLAATVAAKKCVRNDWTFIYLQDAKDLAKALMLAKQYQPALVFVEDVDKAVKAERNEEMDKIFNTLDGVEGKRDEIMVVFTTNELAAINKGMLRAKRLDFVIEVLPPDADAVRRLIVKYTGASLDKTATLDRVSEMLKGQIPATIEEVCSRSKLSAVKRLSSSNSTMLINDKDLETSAYSMLEQLRLTAVEQKKQYGNSVEKAADELGQHIFRGAQGVIGLLAEAAGGNHTNGNGAHKLGAGHQSPQLAAAGGSPLPPAVG